MTLKVKKLWKAPIATLLAIGILSVFIGLRVGKFIESTDLVTITVLIIPLAFSDPFSEIKKPKIEDIDEITGC
jgi:hypothetical protein